ALLPCNGPTITSVLIRLMNALSDGMMILVILLVSLIVLAISIICIRYIVLTGMEKSRREVGMMKAIGIASHDIRKFYMRKYILLSFAGALAGIISAAIISRPLGAQMRDLYGAGGNAVTTVLISFIGIALTEFIMLFSVRRNLKKSEKISAVEALRGEVKGKRKNRGYVFVTVIMAASVFLMLVPQNIASTIGSEKFVTYMGIGNAQIRMDVRQCPNIKTVTSSLLERVQKDPRVESHSLMQTKSIRAIIKDDLRVNLLVEEGDHSVFPLSYISGKTPESMGEISLSNLNASELDCGIGDKITLNYSDRELECRVCGIYSDITNGGKTAKTAPDSNSEPVMWSILYVTLNPGEDVSNWMKSYQEGDGGSSFVKIVDIKQYMEGTYGQTIRRVKSASLVSLLVACLIAYVVVLLFIRLTVWQERNDNSLMKALGLSDSLVRKRYVKKSLLYVAAGIILGILLGILAGQKLAGAFFGMLGASGFRFIIDYRMAFLLIPLEALLVAMSAVRLSLNEIKRIKPMEVALGRE
ncbi:MAG: ABC transporter permease, partial [Treponema sp.]|nr:ABC transporter permease [Treponema sp.]